MKKVLCFSDFHFSSYDIRDLLSSDYFSPKMDYIRKIFQVENPDVVVITGDTVSSLDLPLLSTILNKIFWKRSDPVPLVVSLGNHEMWGKTIPNLKTTLKNLTDRENLVLLDLGETLDTGNSLFLGGILFFDGSMRVNPAQNISPWNGWQDYRIPGVEQDYKKICQSYIRRFKKEVKAHPNHSIILCTHHLPDERLNGHEPSIYSFYSGVKNLPQQLELVPSLPHWMICGHTHRRVIKDLGNGIIGVNTGSDYDQLLYYVIEVP